MTSQPLYLVDPSSARIAGLNVMRIGDLCTGTIDLEETPPQLKRLFQEFEEMVEGQVFNLADEIEDMIGMTPLMVVFANNTEAQIEDLQVYPSTKRVSFKIRQTTTAAS